MCGIAGELRLDAGERADARRVRRMCSVMVHRGPDSFGEHTDGEVGLGMRRLAIVDVAGGLQPLGNEDGSVQVVCNGEIYNAPQLARELEARGHRLRTHCDVEVIAHLYEEHGVDVAAELDGEFAFAIWDARRRRLVLGRDRLGVKPLYVAEVGRRLMFGSEAKCLLAGGLEPEIDRQSLHDYLTLGYVAGPDSIFAGARQVPPGCVLVAEPSRAPETRRYWSLAGHAAPDDGRPSSAWEREFLDTLREAVSSYLMADVPLGVFLSGGLDSGSIVALMHELGVHPIRTFTIDFEERSFSEASLARQVAARYGTEHHELIVRPDAAKLLPTLVRQFDEPYADDSAIPVYYLAELARRHVKVVLSGEGGDEMLGGYDTYRARRLAAWYSRLPRPVGASLVPAIVRHLPVSHAKVSFDYKAKRFVTGAYLPPAAGHLWWKTVFGEDAKAALYADGAGATLAPTERLYAAAYEESDGGDIDRLQYIDSQVYLPADILVKADRMSMAHSLEARVPFLDRRLVEFCRRLPARMRLRGLTSKYVLRNAMRDRLPAAITQGRKRGFSAPMPTWFAGALREYTADMLSAERLRRQGIFRPAAVARYLDEHATRRVDHSRQLLTLLVFSVWYEATMETAREAVTAVAGADA
jgi:asparagine synthase (glutamine-hydrolysing)